MTERDEALTDDIIEAATKVLRRYEPLPEPPRSIADDVALAKAVLAAVLPLLRAHIVELAPAENMALTVALAQVARGEHSNVAAVCIQALARVARGGDHP